MGRVRPVPLERDLGLQKPGGKVTIPRKFYLPCLGQQAFLNLESDLKLLYSLDRFRESDNPGVQIARGLIQRP